MYEVKDGARTLQFDGEKLGDSSSWRKESDRWIEFSLYRTDSGTYILSRLGISLVYHLASCPLVERYGLQDVPVEDLRDDALPCLECEPSLELPFVYPEKIRTWALISDDASAILDALYKYDRGGGKYLTNVAARLLESAAEKDSAIDAAYRVEYIK